MSGPPRPGSFCAALLAGLEVADERRRRRKRDTTPDAIGIEVWRALLARAVRDDPEPGELETWLAARCQEAGDADGAVRAAARDIAAQWRLAVTAPAYAEWLGRGGGSTGE